MTRPRVARGAGAGREGAEASAKPTATLYCQRPDHDVPRIKCGAPLPCPYHTVILDPAAMTLTVPLAEGTRLADIARVLRKPLRVK